jgi:hypothetical protein
MQFILDRQFGPFSWAGLSSLRTVSILKIGYIGFVGIPVAAYILNLIQKKYGVEIHLPITLFWLYFGSTLLALGHLLNEVGCPQIIKRFSTLSEYRSHLAESFSNQHVICEAIKSSLREDIEEKLRIDQFRLDELLDSEEEKKALSEIIADVVQKSDGHKDSGLQNHIRPETEWEDENKKFFLLRLSIVLLYGVSALVVTCFSIRQFAIVWSITSFTR